MEIQIGVIASLILGFTQLITNLYPKINKMNVTLIVTVVVGVISYTISDSVEVLSVILALAFEVLGYNVAKKSIGPLFK